MKHSIAWRAYSKYLRERGCSEESDAGNPSTTYIYPSIIDRICRRENFSTWDELGEHITEIVKKYMPNGSEAEYGAQSHGNNLKALELFMEFYICFD